MNTPLPNISFQPLANSEPPPYGLLLPADPSKDLVDRYLAEADTFLAKLNGEPVGVIVLLPIAQNQVEIKNVAVLPEFQGKGIGSFLIGEVVKIATQRNFKSIIIGTANSSIAQLALYQKLGFEVTEIRKDYFIDNYGEPIFENGIQAVDMVILTRVYSMRFEDIK